MIIDYTTLQAAVTEYLARDQDTTLIARIPTFIQLTEAKLNRDLFVRQMEERTTFTIDVSSESPEFLSLPSDFQSMRRIRVLTTSRKAHLDFLSSIQLDEFNTARGNAPGFPRYFTISGDEIELAPTPDQNYTIEMSYRQNIPPLATNMTNWLLTLAPDIYLYGALLEASPYIKEDARIQTWGLGFTSALNDLNNLNLTSAFNAGPIMVRTSGVTP